MSGGIPPSRGQPASTPPSKGRPDEDKKSKDFRLPDSKGKVGEKQEDKKKGLFDLAGGDIAIKEKQQNIQQDLKTEDIKTEQVSASEAKAQVAQVGQLVQKMVESMRIGQVDGKDFASLNLSASADVPTSFAGSNLTLSYQQNSLAIRFDNFMTPQQENNAITLVEKNKEQLQQMMQTLQAKNIQVSELLIGTHVVSLPEVQPLPPPFQPTAPSQPESQQREREEGRQGRGEGEGEPR